MAQPTFDELFAGFKRSAWRLEVRDTYSIAGDEERIATFERTGMAPRKTAENSGWIRTILTARDRGAHIGRTRLVGRPITPYTRFEFAAYIDNVLAGEDIRVVDRDWLDQSWNHAPDVWVFDGEIAAVMNYTHNGEWLGFDVVDGRPYERLRLQLEPIAVRMDEYRLADVPAPRPGDYVPTQLPPDVATA